MLGLDFDISPPEAIEQFRKMIEKEINQPVETFSLSHKSNSNEVLIKASGKQKVIKGSMLSFMIRKGLKMMLKKSVEFNSIELIHDSEKNVIVFNTKEGIEIQTL